MTPVRHSVTVVLKLSCHLFNLDHWGSRPHGCEKSVHILMSFTLLLPSKPWFWLKSELSGWVGNPLWNNWIIISNTLWTSAAIFTFDVMTCSFSHSLSISFTNPWPMKPNPLFLLSMHRDWKAKLIMLDFYVSGSWPYRVFLPVFISLFIFIPTHLWHAAWSQALLFTNNLSHLGAVNLHQFHLCLIVDRILGIFTPDEKCLKMKFSRWYVRVFLPDLCKMTGQTNSQLDPNLPLFQVSKGNECYISSD